MGIIFHFFGIFSTLISAYIVQEDWYYLLPFLPVIVVIALNFLNKASSSRILTKSTDPSKSEYLFAREFLLSLICQASVLYIFYELTIFRGNISLSFSSRVIAIYFTRVVAIFLPIFNLILDKYSKKRILLARLVYSAYLLIICKVLEDSVPPFINLVFLAFLALSTSMYISILTVILPSISTNSKATNLVSRKIKPYCIFRFKSFCRSVLSFEQLNDEFSLLYQVLKKN